MSGSQTSRPAPLAAAEALLPRLRESLKSTFTEQPIAITGHSVVYKTFSTIYNSTIAVKIIDKNSVPSNVADKFLPRELDITHKVRHPHLARCLGIYEATPTQLVLVSEFYEKGTLLELILKDQRVKEFPQGCRYFRQLIEALNYLHERKIAHRDVKLENIMLDSNGDLKLLDFGFARHIQKRERSRSFCGTRPYSSPQINRYVSYDSYSADYYAAGIVLYTMLVGKWPTDKSSSEQRMLHFPENVPSMACRRLIVTLLEDDENHRAGYDECVNSEWMVNEPNWVFAGKSFVYENIPYQDQ